MDSLSYEIIEIIADYLDPVSLSMLIQTNYRYNQLDFLYYWKHRCRIDYNFISKKKFIWRNKYIQLYKTLCIYCNNKTTLINHFFNIKICEKCTKKNIKYHTICKSHAKRDYFLNDDDLVNIKHIQKKNNLNSKYPMILYLKNDIINVNKAKYSKIEFDIMNSNKINKLYIKNMMKITKFHILYTILNEFNINIMSIISIIDIYSNKMYSKYIKYKNTDNSQLLSKILELNYIIEYTSIPWNTWTDNFDNILLIHLLTSNNNYFNINTYIDNKINTCILNNKDKFTRKYLILNTNLNYNKTNLSEFKYIFSYIYYGLYTIDILKEKILIYNFINSNNLEYSYSDNKTDLILVLNKYYIKNYSKRHLIPSLLYKYIYY